jgi:hypothetical protein
VLELLTEDDRITVLDTDLDGVTDPDSEAAYVLRPLTPEQSRKLRKQHTTFVINKRTHTKDPQVNDDAFADDLIDYVLVDWSGMVSKGQPLPCERAYKLRLDFVRKAALLGLAGGNRTERAQERRAESFRQPAPVL